MSNISFEKCTKCQIDLLWMDKDKICGKCKNDNYDSIQLENATLRKKLDDALSDCLHREGEVKELKAKLLQFQGMTFSENQEIQILIDALMWIKKDCMYDQHQDPICLKIDEALNSFKGKLK